MSLVVDIACPDCGGTSDVHKIAIGRYRCEACDREFTIDEVRPD